MPTGTANNIVNTILISDHALLLASHQYRIIFNRRTAHSRVVFLKNLQQEIMMGQIYHTIHIISTSTLQIFFK